MCSRYSLTSPPDAVRAYFRYHNEAEFPPRYNIAPTQPVAIVRPDPQGRRELALVRWGLVPQWVKDPRTFTTLINARAETVCEKPAFRGAARHRRCIVPADAFYEWTGPARRKTPWMLRARGPGPIGLAGLWECWLGADGSEFDSMAICTVPANALAARVHDRMPAILAPEDFEAWLDTRATSAQEAFRLLRPAPDDRLELFEVSRKINDVRNEGPGIQEIVTGLLL